MRAVVKVLVLSVILLISCSDTGGGGVQGTPSNPQTPSGPVPQDYSRASFINKKLGRGVNFGNAFDAQCRANNTTYPYTTALEQPERGSGGWDGCWSNPIKDDYYQIGCLSAGQKKRAILPLLPFRHPLKKGLSRWWIKPLRKAFPLS